MIGAMRRLRSAPAFLFAAAVLLAAIGHAAVDPSGNAPRPGPPPSPPRTHSPYTGQQFLVAAPSMLDPRFEHAVIYMVEHDAGGAFGLIVNRPIGAGPLGEVLKGFGIDDAGAEKADTRVVLNYGGPVDSNRLFVLHSNDWHGLRTLPVPGPVSVTPHPEVLKAIAEGGGPRHALVIFGYSGWSPGQLETEMARGDWLTAPADVGLIFDQDLDTDGKWHRASLTAGVPL